LFGMVVGVVVVFFSVQEWFERLRFCPEVCELGADRRLPDAVAGVLLEDCFPQEISGRLRRDFPDGPGMRVSYGTVCRTLFVQARGELRT
jgi:transposase, IS30 family